ncbi:MAG: hypothetical protein KAR45_07015 [Desulfobacteraceae bacterium]|nr:hypothetical protein [Desulfobacteraceae bacterium]
MKNNYKWVLLSIILGIVFIFTFLKSPDKISIMLHQVTEDTSSLAVIIHGVYVVLVILGLVFKKLRNLMFSVLLLILSGTASVISIKYLIAPNIIIFITFFILTVFALINKELDFDYTQLKPINKIIGFSAIFFGFYYLHWVEEPVFLNALIYSPLGIVNCPTMIAFCGFLCLLKKPGSLSLEFFVASVTIYFGFFGIMRLGAYIDIVLIITGMFLIIRMTSRLNYKQFFKVSA